MIILKKTAKPGQFVSIKCADTTSPLLKRPFGIHKINDHGIELLIKRIGKATNLLSQKKEGDEIIVLGPLGKGFEIDYKKKEILLVAGGYGIVPLYFLADQIRKKNKKAKIKVFIGGKTKEDIFCADDFKKLNAEVCFSTNDGSYGHKGYVTSILMKEIVKLEPKNCVIYACGPKPLLIAISDISKEEKIKTQVSMEEYLACGIGICMGCAIETVQGKKLVCKDGPVFNAEDLVWETSGNLNKALDQRINL